MGDGNIKGEMWTDIAAVNSVQQITFTLQTLTGVKLIGKRLGLFISKVCFRRSY